jgi:hypothetical protein
MALKRLYCGEATEVLSMGGECLSNPRTVRHLIDEDPGLARAQACDPAHEYATEIDGVLSARQS